MQCNSGTYQLGSNSDLQQLWQERLKFRKPTDVDWQKSQLAAGLKVKRPVIGMGSADSGVGVSASPEELVDKLLEDKYVGIRLYKCQYHACWHSKIWAKYLRRLQLKPLNRLYPWISIDDKQKTNLDVTSLVEAMLRRGHVEAVNKVLGILPIGSLNTTVTALLIAELGNHEFPRLYQLMSEDRACCMRTSDYAGYTKAVSVAVRRTGRDIEGLPLPVHSVSSLAYFELAVGRAGNLTDWDDEYEKRVGPRLPLVYPGTQVEILDELYVVCSDLVNQLLPHDDVWGTWGDFVRRRQAWAPSGSAGGARLEVGGKRIRINKHTYYETVKSVDMDKWLDTAPIIQATGSEKFESGKARAIYGTMPLDQAIQTYLIRPLEARFTEIDGIVCGHVGIQEIADVGVRLSEIHEFTECTMLDYTDFNYQHTLEAQEILFRAVRDRIIDKFGHNEDLGKAAEWVRAAQMNQYVRFPNRGGNFKTTQGMFSGVRSTSFTNTLLNAAYYKLSKGVVQRMYGLQPIHEVHFHQGDDVWISNESRLWAIKLYETMRRMGFEFQPSKQMFDISRGEFLRVLYTEHSATGYLMRAVATLIIKPLQSVIEVAPQAKATGINSALHLLKRRGLSEQALVCLWWSMIPFALKLKLPQKKGVGIPLGIATKRQIDGGLDLGVPGTQAVRGTKTCAVPAPRIRSKELEMAAGRNMTEDWLKIVSEKVHDAFDYASLSDAIHASNISDSLRPRDRAAMLRSLQRDLLHWRSKVLPMENTTINRVETNVNSEEISASRKFLFERKIQWLNLTVQAGNVMKGKGGIVDHILRAIATSPFSDAAQAALALKVGIVQAAQLCLELAPLSRIRNMACSWFNSIRTVLGDDIMRELLRGLHGAGLSYESWLHPIILSWVSRVATDWAVLDAVGKGIKTVEEWDLLFDSWMQDIARAAVQDVVLIDWSHY